ncbi:hypothetical protein M6B38_255520 [Iris pallida]|uniref:Uncharacterized protein n=1 Tax=Iris pallida TaxID=29817 RepID=A0AAX6IHJ0_IRIPA|nr:hypothetical protein M6B38_255520 [Iris pallida]
MREAGDNEGEEEQKSKRISPPSFGRLSPTTQPRWRAPDRSDEARLRRRGSGRGWLSGAVAA